MSESGISADLIRGNIDTIILRVLKAGDNYGYEIMKTISHDSDRQYELKEPTLYTSLKRLEKQGFITSYWGSETQGGRRKYYALTESGNETYLNNVRAWNIAKDLIDRLVNDGGVENG